MYLTNVACWRLFGPINLATFVIHIKPNLAKKKIHTKPKGKSSAYK